MPVYAVLEGMERIAPVGKLACDGINAELV